MESDGSIEVWIDNDPFFAKGPSTEWNACIGRQSVEQSYVDGYILAALELTQSVIASDRTDKVDALAMPILYNARHSLELCLKFIGTRLCDAGVLPVHPAMDHDILRLWKSLSTAQLGDVELRRHVAALRPFVESLHAVDADGQQLRYPKTSEGDKSLKNKSLCNLEVIRNSLVAARELMDKAVRRTTIFLAERRTGTFIRSCSRSDLERIARTLPPRSLWTASEFDEKAAALKSEFELSSTQFSHALNVIQRSRELGSVLGIEFSLLYLSDDQLRFIAKEWCDFHPPQTEDKAWVNISMTDVASMQAHAKKRAAMVQRIVSALSLDEITDMRTIFEIGCDLHYSEEYADVFKSYRRELSESRDPARLVAYLMGKTILLDGLVRGIEVLGRPMFARELRALRPLSAS